MKDNPVVFLLCHSTSQPASSSGRIVFVEYNFYFCDYYDSSTFLIGGVAFHSAPLGLGWCGRPCGVFQPQVEEDIECPSVVILYCCCCGAMSPLLGEWVVGHIHMNWIRMGMN